MGFNITSVLLPFFDFLLIFSRPLRSADAMLLKQLASVSAQDVSNAFWSSCIAGDVSQAPLDTRIPSWHIPNRCLPNPTLAFDRHATSSLLAELLSRPAIG